MIPVTPTAQKAAWRAANPEKAKAIAARYRASHVDELRASNARRREKNREYRREYGRKYAAEYRAKNPEKAKLSKAAYRAKFPERQSAAFKEWRLRNPGKDRARCAKRRANKLRATPAWADMEIMEMVYAEAKQRGLDVDHIIPLAGRNICGLHVYWNTQLLTRSQNARKRNSVVST